MTTLFTSCSSNEDSPATGSERGPTADGLKGTWYCAYEATGFSDSYRENAVSANKVTSD